MQRGSTILLILGLGLLLLGGALLFVMKMGSLLTFVLIGGSIGCVGAGTLLNRTLRLWANHSRLRRRLHGTSAFAGEWIPMLYGNYTPYVIEAAERLGEARETTAVPALLHVLEQTVNTQPPGWRDTAEAIIGALGKMGDRRALPLLYCLTNVRGIGLLTIIQESIDRIEPETSLLRPGPADDLPQETLLRPAASCTESDPATLLRAEIGRP